jgi:hypothetical protein
MNHVREYLVDAIGEEAADALLRKVADESPREYARRLHEHGYSDSEVAGAVRARFGIGTRRLINDWLNPERARAASRETSRRYREKKRREKAHQQQK